jgi:hypothetical protein
LFNIYPAPHFLGHEFLEYVEHHVDVEGRVDEVDAPGAHRVAVLPGVHQFLDEGGAELEGVSQRDTFQVDDGPQSVNVQHRRLSRQHFHDHFGHL